MVDDATLSETSGPTGEAGTVAHFAINSDDVDAGGTSTVDDVAATVASVRAAGGHVLMEPVQIPAVGELAFFADLDGNVCGAMRYE